MTVVEHYATPGLAGVAGTQCDRARFARIEQPPTAQMLARMERDGLIRRTPDPEDGRSQRVVLTEAALSRRPDTVTALFRGNRDALGGFSEAEAKQLVELLSRPLANLDRLAASGQERIGLRFDLTPVATVRAYVESSHYGCVLF